MKHHMDPYADLPVRLVRPADLLPDTYGEVYAAIEAEFKEQHPNLDGDITESIIDSLTTTFMSDYDLGATINTYDPNIAEDLIIDVEDFMAREDNQEYINERLAEDGADENVTGGTYGDLDSFDESARSKKTRRTIFESGDEASDDPEWDRYQAIYGNFNYRDFESKAEEAGPLSEEEMEDLLVKMYRFKAMALEAEQKFNNIQDDEEAENSDFFQCMGEDINPGVAQNVTDISEDITNIMGY